MEQLLTCKARTACARGGGGEAGGRAQLQLSAGRQLAVKAFKMSRHSCKFNCAKVKSMNGKIYIYISICTYISDALIYIYI